MELPPEEMRRLGHEVIDRLVEHLSTLSSQGVGGRASPSSVYSELCGSPPENGLPWQDVLDRVITVVLAQTLHVNHPRFFGFVPGPGNFVGAMADTLAAGWNTFAGTWFSGSGAEALETVTVDWLRQWCGFPETCRGLFVSGGSMANLTALVTARQAVLGDDPAGGVAYLSDQAHASLLKAFRVTGIPRSRIRVLEADGNCRLQAQKVRTAVERDREAGLRPFCVIASAGTTNTGAVDPLPELADLCRETGLWLHVDGAFGAAGALCEEGRRELAGLGEADSLSIDPHKWLFQPFACGCVLLRNGALLRDTFALHPDYLQNVHRNAEEVNYADHGIELTRSFRALKMWMSVQIFGMSAFRDAVARGFELARYADLRIRQMRGWEVVSPAQMGIVCFRNVRGDDRFHLDMVDEMVRGGFAVCTSTTLRGQTVLRMCIINPRTTEQDIDLTLREMEKAAATLLADAKR